ncbi:MAG: tetratricopeptide repeat protein [Blastopirellula sp. JB062]
MMRAYFLIAFTLLTAAGCTNMPSWSEPILHPGRENEIRKQERVESLEQRHAATKLKAAQVHFAAGDTAKCRPLVDEALELRPNSAAALRLAAEVALAEDRGADAIVFYRRLVEQRPDDAQSHHWLGVALEVEGQVIEANRHFERAAQLAPDNPIYRLSQLPTDPPAF